MVFYATPLLTIFQLYRGSIHYRRHRLVSVIDWMYLRNQILIILFIEPPLYNWK